MAVLLHYSELIEECCCTTTVIYLDPATSAMTWVCSGIGYASARASLFTSRMSVTTRPLRSPDGSVFYMTNTGKPYCVGSVLHSILPCSWSRSKVSSISFLSSGPSWYTFPPVGVALGCNGIGIHSSSGTLMNPPAFDQIRCAIAVANSLSQTSFNPYAENPVACSSVFCGSSNAAVILGFGQHDSADRCALFASTA